MVDCSECGGTPPPDSNFCPNCGASLGEADSDGTDGRDVPKREKLLNEVMRLRDELGYIPTAQDMREHGVHDPHEYYGVFGKWRDVLDEAPVDLRAELLAELRKTARELERRPKTAEMEEHSRYADYRYRNYFETWEAALDAAGIEPDSEADIVAELQRLDDAHDQLPLSHVMRDHGQYSANTVRETFGSWDDALDAAGIDKRDRLLDELRRLADDVDRTPTTTHINERSKYSSSYIAGEFGSLEAALSAAGVTGRTSVTDADLVSELRRLASERKTAPLGRLMRDDGRYSVDMYVDRFGGWEEALARADVSRKERMIDELRRVDALVDGPVRLRHIKEESGYSNAAFRSEFESYRAALEEAGAETVQSGSKTDEDSKRRTSSTTDTTPRGVSTDEGDGTDAEHEDIVEQILSDFDDMGSD